MFLLKNGVGGGGGGKVDRQKGLTRTRTDLTLVAQFRKNATRFRSRCNYVSDFDFCKRLKFWLSGEIFQHWFTARSNLECTVVDVSPLATAQFLGGMACLLDS